MMQRLRQIRQTSLVNYVFPGCNHSRFEHTLGVIHQTQKLAEAVNGQAADGPFDSNIVRDLRLAALFHDCGHSCFSHLSEDVYQFCPDVEPLLAEGGQYCGGNAHEVMGSLLLRSDSVRKYVEEVSEHYGVDFRIDRAAGWILGQPENGDEKFRYLTQVINGPFDADKLDYIFRDAHYSGLPLGLDLDRLWACCTVGTRKTDDGPSKILTLHRGSTTPLEQILFNKINLFSVVYQHPKVRAVESMFQGVIEYVRQEGLGLAGRPLDNATDYLWATDAEFFAAAAPNDKNAPLHQMIHSILYRRHFVRALTISKDTLDTEKCGPGYQQLRKLNQKKEKGNLDKRRELAEQICEVAGKPCSRHEVWLDLPPDPPKGEPDRTFVRMPSDELVKMSDIFPMNYWADFYMSHKWRGHVFCPLEHQQAIHKAAVEVLGGTYDIEFNDRARTLSHVPK